MRPSHSAFTLVEMLVVLAIIGLLAGLILPAFTAIRAMASSVKCTANLRQQGVAFMLYAKDWNRHLPPPLDNSGRPGSFAGWNVNLAIQYAEAKPTVSATDTDKTLGSGVFLEPLYQRPSIRPLTQYRFDSGYGMNCYLPPCQLNPTTSINASQNTSPLLSAIAEPPMTPLVADTTNCLLRIADYRCAWGLDRLNTLWHFQYVMSYPHRLRGNILYADAHVESQTLAGAYATFTQTKAYLTGVTW